MLGDSENVQGESASKGYVDHINVRDASEQGWRDVGVSTHEWHSVVSVVLVVVGRGIVAAGPHGSAAVDLRLKTLCAFPLGRYLRVT